MTTDGANGPDAIFLRPLERKPKRRGFPVGVVVLLVAAVTLIGVGAFLWKGAAQLDSRLLKQLLNKPAPAQLVLPEGVASMGDAERCLRSRDLPCAEADLVAYLGQYPNDAHANALLAITLTADGHHREALYYYRKAEALNVGAYDFYAGYAKSLDAVGDTDAAIRMNQAALNLVPRLVDVRGLLADELTKKGRGQEAVDLLESFDRKLEADGYQPYFTDQIRRIKARMGGVYVQDAAASDAPAPAAHGQTVVKGEPMAGTLIVAVAIDGAAPMSFAVDSGASLIVMPSAEAQPLFERGLLRPGDYRGQRPFQLANGTVTVARIYRLRSVRVGDREINDVLAAIYPGRGPSLLGQSFLKRFKSWSIDNRREALVLTD